MLNKAKYKVDANAWGGKEKRGDQSMKITPMFWQGIQTVCYQVWWTNQPSDYQCEWTQEWEYHLRQAPEWSDVKSLCV